MQTLESHRQDDRQAGVALVAVLWSVVLLAMLATALIAMSRSENRVLQGQIARLQAGEAAEAGINLAIVGISTPAGGWPIDGSTRSLKFGDADIEVSVQAEAGKIDLNGADKELIRGLLVEMGLGPGQADSMVEAIVARRPGASDGSAQPGESARTTGFETLGELITIPGMTRDLYEKVAPFLTLYTGSPGVDTGIAPREVLLALPGKTIADVEAMLHDRTSPEGHGLQPAGGDLSRIIGQAFTVKAVARLPDGTIGRRARVIRITGDPRRPVWVLAEM